MPEMSNDTREKIIQSAMELIYARSYSDVGVQEICNHAGIKKGSFYHFFPSKSDLGVAIIEAHRDAFAQQIISPAFDASIAPLRRFEKLMELLYQHNKAHKEDCQHVLGCPVGNLAAEMSTRDENLRITLSGVFSMLKEKFAATLEEAKQQGIIDNIDIEASADAILAYVEGTVLLAKTRNDPSVIKQLAINVDRLLIPMP